VLHWPPCRTHNHRSPHDAPTCIVRNISPALAARRRQTLQAVANQHVRTKREIHAKTTSEDLFKRTPEFEPTRTYQLHAAGEAPVRCNNTIR
jgi:hypothetical protein